MLGCFGLTNQRHYILNTPYPEAEWKILAKTIIQELQAK